MKLVRVTWYDAWFDPEQLVSEDWHNCYEVQTVGYLVRETDEVVSLAQEILPHGDGFRAVTHIPVPVIQRVENLSVNLTTLEVVS